MAHNLKTSIGLQDYILFEVSGVSADQADRFVKTAEAWGGFVQKFDKKDSFWDTVFNVAVFIPEEKAKDYATKIKQR